MIKLKQLLPLLDKEGVDLILLQEGSLPHARDRGSLKPVSRQSTDRAAIEQVLDAIGAKSAVSLVEDGGTQAVPFSAAGRHYKTEILFHKGRLQIRLGHDKAASPKQPPVQHGSPPPMGPPPISKRSSPSDLESILNESRLCKASDVHISAGYPARMRILGRLKDLGGPISLETVENMLMTLLDDTQKHALAEVGYTDLALEFREAGRMRINISRQRGGLKGCFRLISPEPLPLEILGLPPELSKIQVHHQGLVVVSGPNGAGKTTTMASLVDLFNASKPIHIITVEDPVEILHRPKKAVISQRQVRTHTRTFFSALKGALREDPDVIAIGELRDLETVEMALGAAETGHLVIATMSTPSGAVTIDRLIDMFPQGVQPQVRNTLAGTLKMVISQRLIPGSDGKSRHVAAELITGNIPLYAMIRDNKLFQLPSLLQQGKAYGMIRIEDSLNALVEKKLVDTETAKQYANDPNTIGRKTQAPDPTESNSADKRSKLTQMADRFRGK